MNICKVNICSSHNALGKAGTICNSHDYIGDVGTVCNSHAIIKTCSSHVVFDSEKAEEEAREKYIEPFVKAGEETVQKLEESVKDALTPITKIIEQKVIEPIANTLTQTVETIGTAIEDNIANPLQEKILDPIINKPIAWFDKEIINKIENASSEDFFKNISDQVQLVGEKINAYTQEKLFDPVNKQINEWKNNNERWFNEKIPVDDWLKNNERWVNEKFGMPIQKIIDYFDEKFLLWVKNQLGLKPIDLDLLGQKDLKKDIEEWEKAYDKYKEDLEKATELRTNLLKKLAFFNDDELLNMMLGGDYQKYIEETGLEQQAAWLERQKKRLEDKIKLINDINVFFKEHFTLNFNIEIFKMELNGSVNFNPVTFLSFFDGFGGAIANLGNKNYSWEDRKSALTIIGMVAMAGYFAAEITAAEAAIAAGTASGNASATALATAQLTSAMASFTYTSATLSYTVLQQVGVLEQGAGGKLLLGILDQLLNQFMGMKIDEIKRGNEGYNDAVALSESAFKIIAALTAASFTTTAPITSSSALNFINQVQQGTALVSSIEQIMSYNSQKQKIYDNYEKAKTKAYTDWKRAQELRQAEAMHEVSIITKPAYITFASVVNKDVYYPDPENLIPFNTAVNKDNKDSRYGFEDVLDLNKLPNSKNRASYIDRIIYGV